MEGMTENQNKNQNQNQSQDKNQNQSQDKNENKREQTVEPVLETCRKMMECLQMDLIVDGKMADGKIHVNITGTDRPYLLSNSASLLNSLEFLLNRIFKSGKDDKTGIILDSDGYRQHREAELTLLAQMASKKVLSMRKPLGLQPMTPRERRIIHLALAEIEGVRSESTGEGDDRSITIFPS